MQQITSLYFNILSNVKNALDQNFKDQLLKETKIETLDQKWKAPRQQLESYLSQIGKNQPEIEIHLLADKYFLYEDVSAFLLDLIWQDLHEQLNIEETLFFYRNYKIQVSDKNLLQWPT